MINDHTNCTFFNPEINSKMKKLLCITLLFALLAGCKEEEAPQLDAFIFGRWNLLCEGNCIRIYKLDQGKLYVDNMNSFREAQIITYKPTPLGDELTPLAQDLRAAFPEAYMFPRGLDFIGCPDCAEQGGYYLAFENEEGVLWWQVGNVPALWPEEIRPFMQKLITTIDKLPEN